MPFTFCNNVHSNCVVVSRSGGYQGGPSMGGMGHGGPYNPAQSANSSRMNLQGPPYSTMPSGESDSDSVCVLVVQATYNMGVLKIQEKLRRNFFIFF